MELFDLLTQRLSIANSLRVQKYLLEWQLSHRLHHIRISNIITLWKCNSQLVGQSMVVNYDVSGLMQVALIKLDFTFDMNAYIYQWHPIWSKQSMWIWLTGFCIKWIENEFMYGWILCHCCGHKINYNSLDMKNHIWFKWQCMIEIVQTQSHYKIENTRK